LASTDVRLNPSIRFHYLIREIFRCVLLKQGISLTKGRIRRVTFGTRRSDLGSRSRAWGHQGVILFLSGSSWLKTIFFLFLRLK
jgi:hypothetical protein